MRAFEEVAQDGAGEVVGQIGDGEPGTGREKGCEVEVEDVGVEDLQLRGWGEFGAEDGQEAGVELDGEDGGAGGEQGAGEGAGAGADFEHGFVGGDIGGGGDFMEGAGVVEEVLAEGAEGVQVVLAEEGPGVHKGGLDFGKLKGICGSGRSRSSRRMVLMYFPATVLKR